MPKPTIDSKRCNHCGTCVEICPMTVFRKEDGKILVSAPEDCIGCRACEAQCAKQAIVVEE